MLNPFGWKIIPEFSFHAGLYVYFFWEWDFNDSKDTVTGGKDQEASMIAVHNGRGVHGGSTVLVDGCIKFRGATHHHRWFLLRIQEPLVLRFIFKRYDLILR